MGPQYEVYGTVIVNKKNSKTDGLAKFEGRLCKTVIADIRAWESDASLRPLFEKLQSVTKPRQFLDHYSEALMARHLASLGNLEVEVPNGLGRHADFKFVKDGQTMFLHLKRLNEAKHEQKQGGASSRIFTALNKMPQPFWVTVELFRPLDDQVSQNLTKEIKAFVKAGTVGDSREFCDKKGTRIARSSIHCRHNGSRVLTLISHPFCLSDDNERIAKHLSVAYGQFVPKAVNLIVISASRESSFEDLEPALRSRNGFWSGRKHPESRAVVWFSYSLQQDWLSFKLLFRTKEDAEFLGSLTKIFQQRPTASS